MDAVNSVLDLTGIVKAFVGNPILASVGLGVLLIVMIILKIKGKEFRVKRAEVEKEKDKAKNQDRLEEDNAESDGNMRDRLRRPRE